MSAPSRRVMLTVPEAQHRALRREARRLGVPVTVVIMGAIGFELDRIERLRARRAAR